MRTFYIGWYWWWSWNMTAQISNVVIFQLHMQKLRQDRSTPSYQELSSPIFQNLSVSLSGVQTKCQPDECQPQVGILSGLFLWLAFCPSQFLIGILSGTSQHVLALCPNHEKCRHALSIKDPGMWIPWGHQVGLMSFDDKSYVPVHKWFRFFWRTNGSTGGM